MVVAELGESLSGAMEQISNETVVVDEKVLKEFLEEITGALLRSDVQFKFARDMEYKVKNIVNLEQENKRGILQQAIFSELCKMVDGGKPSFTPQKGKASVIMFVGLPGSGKSTTCAKYAHYHSIKGWKPALVCADTATFHQLKQIATDANIPFYGSCTEADPLKIAVEGVERFKKENCDLIIVDTCDFTLFEEMRQAFEAMKPDLVIFVMDSSIGRAAFEQAQAFQQSISVGAVILTKMDGHAKGAGALTAVAAAKSPVIFIGAGDNMDDDFKIFDAKQFVGRLLGMGNWSGLMDKLHDVVPTDPGQDLLQKLNHLKFTPRIMYERNQFMVKNNPFRQLSTNCLESDRHWERRNAKTKKYVHMMDWMTNEELDNPEIMNESRIRRIAQESGHQVHEVTEMMESYEYQAEYYEVSRMQNKLAARSRFRYMRAQHTDKVVAPQLLGDLQNPMQQMTSAEEMMGRSCQELPTELDAPQAVKEALHSSEHDATCVVVDIIPPGNSIQPATPRKKPNKLRPFTSWRKLWDSVDKLSEEGFAMLAKRDEEDVHMLVERKFWPGLHGILAPTSCLKRFFVLVLFFCGLYHLVSGALTRLI